ncbi:MAG TPA: metallophosphoesterase [Steroidobacteraceae bacterium]|nr:metallophosphoesterase [Steroidobacteraceae bacterium]
MTSRRALLNPFWLILLLPVYISWRLLPALSIGPVAVCASIAFLILCCVVVPLAVRSRSIRNANLADLLAWIGVLSMGAFSSLLVLTLLRDVVLLGGHFFLSAPRAASLSVLTARGTLALTAFITLAGLVIALRKPRVVHVDIPVADLPEALHGFSIAQISDVHVGPTIKRGFVESIVAVANGLKADLIAVTGDLVDGSVQQLSVHTAPLAGLAARHGVYFVTGNHEYYSGERAWTAEIRRLGLQVLKNQHVVLNHDGASLVLAGVTDLSAHHFSAEDISDPVAALRGAPAHAGAKILLAHQPNSAPAAARAGFHLQISGHTHGGQFWPWNWFVGFFQRFTGGLYRLQNLWVYVNRGTGYWGPPNRFGVPSEITRIRLIAAAP